MLLSAGVTMRRRVCMPLPVFITAYQIKRARMCMWYNITQWQFATLTPARSLRAPNTTQDFKALD